jgi:pimeloyl-ACP methyl ester carboxylesterase
MVARKRNSRRSRTDVVVQRVYDAQGDNYVRVNSIGTGGIRPFVLVPGIGVSSTYFERLAPNLNEFGPVYALDLPGFGGVPHPDHALGIREYADLVGKVIDDLALDDPIVVGHSMGSQVVSDLASRRPELSTLVLIGPVVNPAERTLLTQARRFLVAATHEPGRVKALAITAYLFCGFKWFSRVLPKMMSYPIEDALPLIRAHTLVIRGEFDGVAPRDWVKRVGELLPSSRLWEIPGAAHSVMYAHAEEVARLCVVHARETAGDAAGDTALHVAPVEDRPEEEPMDAAAAAKSLGGRLTEAVGVITDDDALIEKGKTQHAEALDEHGAQ